ncbi:MAG: MotA/TolQ/ExbB proton channel [candidate division TM6 bacterium GW2011_GWF2_28_16]|nr:MAG: MotA/TolQ/ExbB proton channel [candidate division TM6 bacterium GW2011_GWF2_28_16]
MFDFIFKSPAWALVAQSDWMTKFILLGLFFLSVICFAIVLLKSKELKKQKLDLENLLNKLKKIKNFENLIELAQKEKSSVAQEFLSNNLIYLKEVIENKNSPELSLQNMENLELMSFQNIDQILVDSEKYLHILNTSASVSPLIGLFGTIWGLIHSFVNISQEKSADIAIVAPGIAEALVTTLAGLIVAIPAMIAYNYYANEIRKHEQLLSHITDRYMVILKNKYLK